MRAATIARGFALVSPSVIWAACAASPAAPPVLSEVAEVRQAPASREAEAWAPQAWAHANGLAEQARRELEQGDVTAAEISGEHALAAAERAWVLARLARAERRRASAEQELGALTKTLAELTAQQQRLSAEIAGVEVQSLAARAALPAQPSRTSEQLASRSQAAEALALQARLLCVGARLLGQHEQLSDAFARLDQLDRQLGAGQGSEFLEPAVELRAQCLDLISSVRRAAARDAGAPGAASSGAVATPAQIPADLLLAELSALGLEPSRDERGVAVTLRGLFAATGPTREAARAQLAKLAEVAKGHPQFPVLVVSHSAAPDAAGAARNLAALSSELRGLGVGAVEAIDAGARQPLLPPSYARASERNARVELVFVAPGL